MDDSWKRLSPEIQQLLAPEMVRCPCAAYGIGSLELEDAIPHGIDSSKIEAMGYFRYILAGVRVLADLGQGMVLFVTRWPLHEAEKVR